MRQILLEKGTIDFRSTMNGVERKMIQTALELSEGCVTQAANMLQVKRTTLIGRMTKLGIVPKPH